MEREASLVKKETSTALSFGVSAERLKKPIMRAVRSSIQGKGRAVQSLSRFSRPRQMFLGTKESEAIP